MNQKEAKMKKVTCWAIWSSGDLARQDCDNGLPHLYMDKDEAIDSLAPGERIILVEIRPIRKPKK